MRALTITGTSDSATIPTVQNQLVDSARDPLAAVGAHLLDDPPGRGEHVPVNLELGRADSGRGDEARRPVAADRDDHHLHHDADGRAAVRRREPARRSGRR